MPDAIGLEGRLRGVCTRRLSITDNYLFGMTENRVPQSSNHTIVVIFHASIRISFSSKHQLSSPC
jgi:hypothetical protein